MKNQSRLSHPLFSLLLSLALLQPAAAAEAPSFKLEGFATVKAYGLETTTGGGDAPVTVVRTPQEFQAAAERSDLKDKKARNDAPRVIQIANDLDLGELANERGGSELKSVGLVRIRPHTTIYSTGEGATIRHGVLDVHGAANVIIRNLKFRDLWEFDPTGKYDRYGWDYVRITNSGKDLSHHVWVDHCDFGKAYDGALDITHGSDLVTISWCKFGGDDSGPHKKVMLIGHSSSDNAAALDKGRLNVTLHHNYFHNIADRAPRARFGNIHAFNNLVDGAENATMSLMNAVTLVENSVYRDARVATSFSHAADNVKKGREGTLVVVNSKNENPRLPDPAAEVASETEATDAPASGPVQPKSTPPKEMDPNREFELANNFQSSVERAALQFNSPADWTWENRNTLPYAYSPDPVDEVPELVTKFAGTGKVDFGPAR